MYHYLGLVSLMFQGKIEKVGFISFLRVMVVTKEKNTALNFLAGNKGYHQAGVVVVVAGMYVFLSF